jgi:type IV fimbrial biogenesis protein FimT
MKLRAKFVSPRRSPRNGFSLVELVLSLAVLLVITTLAIPVVVRSLQAYQLNASASQLAGMLKFTKFDAIRQNTKVSCQIAQSGSNWIVWVDSNGNGVRDGAEPEMVITGVDTLLPASSVPDPSPISATLGPGASTLPWMVRSLSRQCQRPKFWIPCHHNAAFRRRAGVGLISHRELVASQLIGLLENSDDESA